MWFKIIIPAVIAISAFVSVQNSFAATENEAKSAGFDLGQVVVAATRSEISLFDVPQAVTVISGEDTAASPFERVEDIVRTAPGLFNFRHYGLQTNGIVNPLIMRGAGQNRVLVLVDGVPQNDNFNNGIAWVAWGHIPKEAVERIEIVRGPTSALYGSEGLGGVINIITKNPREKRQTSIRGQGGTANTYSGYGFHSQKIRDFGFLLSGGYEESDGFYMTRDPERYNIKRYRETGKILGKAAYDFNPSSRLTFSALYFDQDAGQGREFFHNDLQLDQYWLNYSQKGDNLNIKGLLYLNRVDKTAFQDSAGDNYASLDRKEKFKGTHTWGADLQGTLLNFHPAYLTLGAAYKEAVWRYDEDYAKSARDAGGRGTQRFISPFAALDMRFFEERLFVNLGARCDWIETLDGANWDTQGSGGKPAYDNKYDDSTESSFSPKLGVSWHPDNTTTLRASAGKGFRAPSLFELYKVHVRQGGTYYRAANPNLKPEEIRSYDIGAGRYMFNSLLGKLTFYQSFAKDYIGDRLTGTGTFSGGKTRYEYQLDNINKVNIHGIEAELEWYPMHDIMFFTSYTYNISKVKEDSNNAALAGNYLPYDPRHKVRFGCRYQNPGIADISLTGNYYADICYDNENTLKPGDYFTMDTAVARKIFEGFTAYVNVENIFNKEYPIFRSLTSGDTTAPGIVVTAGARLEF